MKRKRLSGGKMFVILFVLAVVISISVCIFRGSTEAVIPEGYLSVHYINVGQGDAALIIDPEMNTILIDTGTPQSKYILTQYLKKYKVSDIDLLILSHPHSDHIGGASEIIGKFKVKKILMPEVVSNTPVFENLLDVIERRGKEITVAQPNDMYTVGNMTVTVLGPLDTYSDENDMSIVAKVTYGNNSFLFTGDISSKTESDLLSYYKNGTLESDILKIPHHGSRYSSSDSFLDTVSPSLAVISCGADNDYGHPHREILQRLDEQKIDCLVTSKQGTVILASNGSDIILVSPSSIQ